MPDPSLPAHEEALLRLAALVDSSDDAIIGKTLDGVITSWNTAAERMFGYTASEAVGQHITLIIPKERRREEDDVIARIRRGERLSHFETVRRRKDEQLVEVSLSVSPVRDAHGDVVGASKVARDISERRALDQLRRTLFEHEKAARAEAEALNRSKNQFLPTLSHQLGNPLNSVYGWSRMLETGRLDPGATTRATQGTLRGAEAQAQLIEDLFDVSRVI